LVGFLLKIKLEKRKSLEKLICFGSSIGHGSVSGQSNKSGLVDVACVRVFLLFLAIVETISIDM
jgi:hypothetical protein